MLQHSFSVEVALRYGLAEAIVLQCLSRWLKERTTDSDYVLHDGQGWLRLTLKQFQGELPYFSPFKLKSALDVLQGSQLIRVADAAQNQVLARRKVMSYTLTERGCELTQLGGGGYK